jgi:protease PrsW
MILWATIVWWSDRFEKEPVSLLAMAFLWGVAPAVGVSILFEMMVLPALTASSSADPNSILNLLNSRGWAPLVEEGIKLLGLVGLVIVARNEIDGPMDGIVYAAMIGFGFAATENTLYFLTSKGWSDFFLLFFLRAMLFGAAHAMFAAFSGWGLVMGISAKQSWKGVAWVAAGFILAVGMHWLHNTGLQNLADNPWNFILSVGLNLAGVMFIILLLCGALIRESHSIKKYLYPYVHADVISLQQWRKAGSIRARLSDEWNALSQWDLRDYLRLSTFYSVCAELAFKEKQRVMMGPSSLLDSRIEYLRKRLVEITF